MRYSWFYTIPILLLLACSSKQSSSGLGSLETMGITVPEGQLMIINSPSTYFTFLIHGKEIKNYPFDDNGPFKILVDKSLLQFTTLPISDIVKGKADTISDLDLLAMHQKYETKYLSSLVNTEFNVYSQHLTFLDGRQCMIWTLDTKNLPTQVLISTVVRPRIFLMSTALLTGDRSAEEQLVAEEEIVRTLIQAMQSIERKAKPIDHRTLLDSIAMLFANSSSKDHMKPGK